MRKHADSTDRQILDRIKLAEAGRVFAAADFLDLGSRAAVDQALSRNQKAGLIRKVARGLYENPSTHPLIGRVSTKPEEIAKAVAGRDATRLQPTGASAANAIGLSDQVPMKVVFLTDGRSRKLQLGKTQVVLRHTTPRFMATAGSVSGTVIQALRWIGRKNVDAESITRLRRRLSDDDKKQLLRDLRYAPAWIADVMRDVARP